MRSFFCRVGLLGLSLCLSAHASMLPPVVPAVVSTMFLPGRRTVRLDHLDPEFRKQVSTLIGRLEAQGYRVRIETTYRSSRRQDLLYNLTQFGDRLGFEGGFTNLSGGKSCHNHTRKGEPASLAVDVWGYPFGPFLSINPWAKRKHSAFFKALGKEARHMGLNWGGDFSRSWPWRNYGFGKDPPHVSSRRCSAR